MIGTAVVATALSIAAAQPVQMRGVVLDNVRIIDGSGAAPIENGRIVIERDRIAYQKANLPADQLISPVVRTPCTPSIRYASWQMLMSSRTSS